MNWSFYPLQELFEPMHCTLNWIAHFLFYLSFIIFISLFLKIINATHTLNLPLSLSQHKQITNSLTLYYLSISLYLFHTYIHTYTSNIHTYILTYLHTNIYTYTYTYTKTYIWNIALSLSPYLYVFFHYDLLLTKMTDDSLAD